LFLVYLIVNNNSKKINKINRVISSHQKSKPFICNKTAIVKKMPNNKPCRKLEAKSKRNILGQNHRFKTNADKHTPENMSKNKFR
jgi:hypothetical protein